MNKWPLQEFPKFTGAIPEMHLATTSGNFRSGKVRKEMRMYVCGITPYDATHLGHAATYLTFDLINRYQRASGVDMKFVENITDIDDPLFERAKRDNLDWANLGASQIELFKNDMSALRILPPDDYVAVTDAMELIVEAVERLAEMGFTYELNGDTYFKISDFLSDLPFDLEEATSIFADRGGDPSTLGKENALDPILWVSNKPDQPGWVSKLGFGRPGWHVECSVIALRYLVGTEYLSSEREVVAEIDLQGGGSDLIFPHHFMTAAIGKALTSNNFAAAYLHSGMVGLGGEKMSKSKGNLVLVSTLLNSGFDPMEIRHALLSQHYAEDRMWFESTLLTSRVRVAAIRSALSRIQVAPTDLVLHEILKALANDLDTPGALETIDNWVSATENGAVGGSVGEISRFIDSFLGLAL